MRFFLKPDYNFESVYDITGEELSKNGIKVLIVDLDNTIGKYEDSTPTEKTVAWVENIKSFGIRIAVVSNNDMDRVKKYCEPLAVDYYWDSKKPRRRTIRKAMDRLGGTPGTTALIGDKIITDILGAKRSGVAAIKVKPLGKRRIFE